MLALDSTRWSELDPQERSAGHGTIAVDTLGWLKALRYDNANHLRWIDSSGTAILARQGVGAAPETSSVR